MKKQTTALAASFLLVLVLVGLLIFLIFRFQTQEEEETGETQSSSEEVLLSLSVDDINTIQIQNPNDEFTLVNQGDGFVIEGLEELDVSSLNVSNLTACFSNLTAQRKLLSLSEETEAERFQRLLCPTAYLRILSNILVLRRKTPNDKSKEPNSATLPNAYFNKILLCRQQYNVSKRTTN